MGTVIQTHPPSRNFNLLILLMLFYGRSCGRASCINGKSRTELPATYEVSCLPLNRPCRQGLRPPRMKTGRNGIFVGIRWNVVKTAAQLLSTKIFISDRT